MCGLIVSEEAGLRQRSGEQLRLDRAKWCNSGPRRLHEVAWNPRRVVAHDDCVPNAGSPPLRLSRGADRCTLPRNTEGGVTEVVAEERAIAESMRQVQRRLGPVKWICPVG